MLRRVVRSRRLFMLTLATVLTVTGAWASAGGVSAAPPKQSVPVPSAGAVTDNGLRLTAAQQAKVSQAIGFISDKNLWGEFSLTADGTLTTVDSLSVIQAQYSLSAGQVSTIQGVLSYAKQNKVATTTTKTGVVQPNAFMNGTVIYLTYSEMTGLLFSAAVAGPVALAAAINALSWILGGPFGGAIALFLTFFGAPGLANLAYVIVQAHALHQGIHFGITWNWFFPNPDLGTWCGCN